MVKRSTLLLSFLFLMCLAFTSRAQQYTLTDDDVEMYSSGMIKSCSYDFSLTDIIIPDTLDGYEVISIAQNVFKSKGITSVVFPSVLQKIYNYSFYNNSLSELDIPDSVTYIGTGAFNGNQITSVTIPDGITELSIQVFYNNKLTSITIPDGVTTIGENAFAANKLTNVSLPNSLYSIGENAFGNNSSLSSIILPTLSISGQTLLNWIDSEGDTYENGTEVSDLTRYYMAQFAYTLTDDDVEVVDGEITSCSLPDYANNITIPDNLDGQTIIGLGDKLFYRLGLTGIDLPQTLIKIGDSALESNNLTSLDLPTTLTSIGENAFFNNSLEEVILPESLTTIGEGAFKMNSLEEIVIPESVTSLGESAFAYNSLTKVEFPTSFSRIESETFQANYDLADLNLPDSLTYIGDKAFIYCYDLSAVTIPNTVSYIGLNAFYKTDIVSFTLPSIEKEGYSTYWLGSDEVEYAAGAEVTDKTLSYSLIYEISAYQLSDSSIVENSSLATLVGTLSLIDEGTDQILTYTIAENDYFEISGDSLISKSIFDYETQDSYSVKVTVLDQDSLSYSDSLTIQITDTNEAPTAIALSNDSIVENQESGSFIATLTATDEDVDQTFTYSIADNEYFKISGDSLISKAACDFETQDSCSIEISVSDQDSLSYSESFNITITDINDAPTAISLSNDTIAENLAIGTEIGALTATDEDVDQTFTYSILENEYFELSGDSLISKAIFDFESQDSYSVEVTVTDQGDLSFTESVSIQIEDANEAPTAISLSNDTIAENLESGTFIASLEATDEDADQTFTYTISDNEDFTLVGDSLISKVSFDFETQESYVVEITVTDQDGLSHTQSLTIQVTDELPSGLSLSRKTLSQNPEIGDQIGTLSVESKDDVMYGVEENDYISVNGDKLIVKAEIDQSISLSFTAANFSGNSISETYGFNVYSEQNQNMDAYFDDDVAVLKKIISDNSGNTLGWDDEEYDTWSGLTWNTDSPARLTGIDISDSRLSGTLDLSDCTELTSINCGVNNIDSLVLGNLTSLTSLDCYWNNLTSLDVSGLEALTDLNCSANNLTSLDLSSNEELTSVNANYNNFTYINCKNGNSSNLDLNTNIRYGNLLCIQVDDVDNFPKKDYPDDIYSTNCDFNGVDLPVIDYSSIVDINSEEAVSELTTPTLLGNNTDLVTITNDASLPISELGITVVTWTFNFDNKIVKTAKQYIAINKPNVVSVVENFEFVPSFPSSHDPSFDEESYISNSIISDPSLGDIVGVESVSTSDYTFEVGDFYTDDYISNGAIKYYPSFLPDNIVFSALFNTESKPSYPFGLKIFNADGDSIMHIGHVNFPDFKLDLKGVQLSNHSIDENIAIGETLGILSKMDWDTDQSYSFSIEDNSYFSIDGDQLIVKDTLNFELNDNLPIAITMTGEDGRSDTGYFNIFINDINEAPTAIALSNDSIVENQESGTFVATLEATDEDADQTFTYSIADNEYFKISGDSLISKAVCDFETQNPYTLEITVFDQDSLSYTESFNITITDINEAPIAIQLSNATIAENSSIGSEVGTLTATDEDADQTFTYSLADNTNFEIVGDQLVSNSALDFESQDSYSVEVTVSDQDSLSYSEIFTINITDENEIPTAIQLSNATIAENSTIGTEVGTLTTTDEDADQSFTYTIAENENFEVEGDKLITKTNLDFETQTSYSVEIRVTDQGDLSYSETFSITITDANEAPTGIQLSNGTIIDNSTISENAAIGTEVGELIISDEDADQTFTYSISENEFFEISGDSLITKTSLNFESQDSYSVEITVSDQGDLSYSETFTINITDVNEAPTAIQLSNATIAENSAIGSEVGTLTATDEDADQTLTYSLTDNTNFEIIGDQLVSNSALDFESQDSYSVEVTVTDQGDLSYSDIFSITITDINEAPTAISLSNATIAENFAIGSEVGTLTATDEDADQTFTYSLADNTNFEIIGDQLVSNSAFDFENQDSYSVEVTVSDQDNLSYSETFSITITDENEAPTAIQLSNATIAENSAIGSEVATLTATDEDADQSFTYSLADNTNFEIVGDQLVSNSAFDFETQDSYSLEVTVTDQDNLSYSETFSITITDENEAPTAIQLSNASIAENSAIGSEVGTLNATDEDADQSFTYSLADNTNFEIIGDQLVSNSAFDFENQDSYSVEVTVSDQDNLSYSETFNITITDENEAPTAIQLSNATIAENSSIGSEVGTLTATDEDADQTFTYSLADNTNFEIIGDQLVSNSAFDFETQDSYSLEVTVTDQDNLSYSETFIITITDVNEAPTAIQLSNATIAENSTIGSEVGTLTATDVDADQSFTYSLADNTNFEIVGDQLVSNSAFDFETQDSYSLEVTVTDQDNLSYSETFNITITDENEAPTAIQLSNATIAENSAIGSEVATLTATDEDADQTFTYSLTDNTNFEIVGDQLVSNSVFDFETQDSYSVEVTVTDQDNLSYSETFSITITDENEAPTAIQLSNATIAENSAIGSEVATLTASDVDADQTFTYSLTDNTNFEIVGDQLVSNSAFDFENQDSYSLEVTVTDQDNLSYSETFNITITDENEAPTAIQLSNATIAENSAIGSEVGTLTATDEDADQTFTYSLTDNTNFEIVGDQLVSNSAFDFESQDSYSVEVTVTDQDNLSYSETFNITITDENEAPTAIQLSNATIAENSAIGSEVGILTASDVDADQTLIFTMAENEFFELTGDKLVSKAEFDYEAQDFYSIEISASDEEGMTYSESFTIIVEDENELPEFLSEPILKATTGETYLYEIEYQDVDQDGCTVSLESSYDWLTFTDYGDGSARLSGVPKEGGIYSIILKATDSEFSVWQEFEIEVETVTGIEDVFAEPDVSIYPNPVANELHVDLSDYTNTDFTISLHSMSGAQLYRKNYKSIAGEAQISFSVQQLPSGFYFLMIESDDYRKSYKIVKL